MERLTITGQGDYTYQLKPELVESLLASIESHMKAYGLKEIVVKAEVHNAPL